jgi:hypothetical protein
MNVNEITGSTGQESLVHYVATTLAFACATTWLVIACQSHNPLHSDNSTPMERAGWPMLYFVKKFKEKWGKGSVRDIEMPTRG